MDPRILKSLEPVWAHHCEAIVQATTEARQALEEFLRVDEYQRHGHEPAELARTLGPLGSAHLDLGALSRTLDSGAPARALPAERLSRIESLLPQLQRMQEVWSKMPIEGALASFAEEDDEILARAAAHFAQLAEVFRAVRVAQLEARSKYEPRLHDSAFAEFSARDLGPGELRLSPPFVVSVRLDEAEPAAVRRMLAILETGIPVKLLALSSGMRKHPGALSSRGLAPAPTLETLPLAMQGVYFVQTFSGAPGFEGQLLGALSSPHAAVISVLCPRAGEEDAAFVARAERAVRARAFPSCLYDPDRDERLGLCVDISGNPASDQAWSTEQISGQGEDGEPVELEEPFTVAHFAADEPEFQKHFSDPPPAADALVRLTDYMALSRHQRLGKLPFIYRTGDAPQITRKVVSQELVFRCAERLDVWRILQELSGTDNPHVVRAREALERELGSQRAEQLESLRKEMENEAKHREQAAVTATVRKLVARLTGVDPAGN